MIFKFIMFVALIATSQLVQAENHLLLIGGGGEPEGDGTIFDTNLYILGSNLKNLKWNYEISFNGGHKKTEEIIEKNYSKSKSPRANFTPENFKKLIDSYKIKIENNEIKTGDQLMILIDSHGAQREPGELSHKISLSSGSATNYDNLEGSDLLVLDKLQEIIQLTNKKGIKLGIVDLSCHSGATLALKNKAPNTCIVSSTSPNHLSYGGFGGTFSVNFLRGLKSGLSLEEIFLKARLESNDNGYPMISTNENNVIVDEVFNKITPYLYYYSSDSDKLTPYIFQNITVPQLCKRESEFNSLISKIDSLKSVLNSKFNSFNGEILKENLLKYKEAQDKILHTSVKLYTPKLDNIEIFTYQSEEKSIQFTWRELVEIPTEDEIVLFENQIKSASSKQEEKEILEMINFIKNVDIRKKEIIKENPQLLTYLIETKSLILQIRNTYLLVEDIAKYEKAFYDELYRRNKNVNFSDPCTSFIL